MTRFWQRLAGVLIVSLILSMLGRITPVGDSFAAFRIDLIWLAVVIAAVLAWHGSYKMAGLTFLISIIAAYPVLKQAPTASVENPVFTLHQQNLLHNNRQISAFTDRVLEQKPAAITIQEIAGNRDQIVDNLKSEYPHFQLCSYKNAWQSGSVGVMVRDLGALLDSGCAEKTELAWITIQTASGPVTFASLHLFWPWPQPQAQQFTFLEPALAELQQPVILGGDFNNAPWASIVQKIANPC